MNLILAFFGGFLTYVAAVSLAYNDYAKSQWWYYWVGIGLAIVGNYLWLWIAKSSPEKNSVYFNGLVWDSIIVGVYSLVPIAMFGVRFSMLTGLGVLMVVIGMITIKVAG